MIKLAIPLAIGLLIGLGGSTAAVVFLGGGTPSLPESLAAALGGGEATDSTAAESVPGDSVTHAAGPADDGSVAMPDGHAALVAHDSTMVPGTADAGHAGGAPEAVPAGTMAMASAAPAAQSNPGMSPAALAELFATMSAREAARVLTHMEDQEVQVILGQLENREAAAILSNLSPERAAVISRTILRGERSTP